MRAALMSGDVSLSTAKSGTVGAEFGAGLPDLPVKRGPAIAFMIIDDTVIMETATAPWPQPGSASARAADPLIRVTTELAVAAVVGVSVAANILCQHDALMFVKGAPRHFRSRFWGSEKDAERAVCWVADKTGKVHSGEGKLLLGHTQQVRKIKAGDGRRIVSPDHSWGLMAAAGRRGGRFPGMDFRVWV
jgi:hypothetical protein